MKFQQVILDRSGIEGWKFGEGIQRQREQYSEIHLESTACSPWIPDIVRNGARTNVSAFVSECRIGLEGERP